jgi:hypothetical protein
LLKNFPKGLSSRPMRKVLRHCFHQFEGNPRNASVWSGGLPLVDTITSMTTCSVMRCPEAPTGAFELIPGSRLKAPVCEPHLAALEQGASWMLHSGTGVEDPRIVMGEDLPDNRLIGFGVSRTVGDVPGFSVEVNIETPEGQQQVSFWRSADIGKQLGSFLTNPPAKG